METSFPHTFGIWGGDGVLIVNFNTKVSPCFNLLLFMGGSIFLSLLIEFWFCFQALFLVL